MSRNSLYSCSFRQIRPALALFAILAGTLLSSSPAIAQSACQFSNNLAQAGTLAVGSASAYTLQWGAAVTNSPCVSPTIQSGGAPFISNVNNVTVSIQTTNCTTGTALANCTITFNVTPTASGKFSFEVLANDINGNLSNAYSFLVQGTGGQAYGTLSVSPSALSCGTKTVGASGNCGTSTLTANGGSVTLPSPLYTLSASTGFLVSGGTCTAGETLNSGQSCTLGPIDLSSSSPGSFSATLTVSTANSGAGSIVISGNAVAFQCRPNASQNEFCLVNPLR